MEEAADAKARKTGVRLCCLCDQRRAALKRPKTLEQVTSHPFVNFHFFPHLWQSILTLKPLLVILAVSFGWKRFAGSVFIRCLRKRYTRWLLKTSYSSLVTVLLLVPLVVKVICSLLFLFWNIVSCLLWLMICLLLPIILYLCRFYSPCLCVIWIKSPA